MQRWYCVIASRAAEFSNAHPKMRSADKNAGDMGEVLPVAPATGQNTVL